MDERQKILQQLSELGRAQAALMDLRPPEVDGFHQLSGRVSSLQLRFIALSNQPLPQLNAAEVQKLTDAVQGLKTAVTQSAGATQIMTAATTLLNS